MPEPLRRHESYMARIVTDPMSPYVPEMGTKTTAIPYCKQDGVPWPCEVEQRDRIIDLLTEDLIAATTAMRTATANLNTMSDNLRARQGRAHG